MQQPQSRLHSDVVGRRGFSGAVEHEAAGALEEDAVLGPGDVVVVAAVAGLTEAVVFVGLTGPAESVGEMSTIWIVDLTGAAGAVSGIMKTWVVELNRATGPV